jgi:hypothetical protein
MRYFFVIIFSVVGFSDIYDANLTFRRRIMLLLRSRAIWTVISSWRLRRMLMDGSHI